MQERNLPPLYITKAEKKNEKKKNKEKAQQLLKSVSSLKNMLYIVQAVVC